MQAVMTGARLAYVVRKLEGTVKSTRHILQTKAKDKNGRATLVERKEEVVEEPAGYMVYFPRGHAIRLSKEGLRQYGLDKEPQIVNLQGLQDPNSPTGKLFLSQDPKVRSAAMADLEKMVIQLATAKSGPVLGSDLVHEEAA